MPDWGWVCVIFLCGGAVQGTAGFGFGLTALALLGLVTDLRDAAVLVLFGALAINAIILLRVGRHFRLERMRPFLLLSLAGVPLGVLGLARLDLSILHLFLGVLLLASAVQRWIPALAARRWHPLWCGAPLGLLSGLLSGAFGTGGPPAVAYVAAQQFARERYAATLQVIFAVAGLFRLGVLSRTDLLTAPVAGLGLFGALFAVAGALAGLRLQGRLSQQALAAVISVCLFLFGLRYLALLL
ncbi:MAG: TSUP family transporter [Planctomycetota bacterium]